MLFRSDTRSELLTFVNPEIIDKQGIQEIDEGCLSVPGIYEPITRSKKITVRALNRDGKEFTLEAEDLLAVCIQHEMDHLDGKVFVDYLSRLKRTRIQTKLLKQNRKSV